MGNNLLTHAADEAEMLAYCPETMRDNLLSPNPPRQERGIWRLP
jgi:hypothetical protein